MPLSVFLKRSGAYFFDRIACPFIFRSQTVLLSEQKRRSKPEQQSCCDAPCCGGETACEYAEETIAADGFSYAFGKEVSEACQRYSGSCSCEVRKGLIHAKRREYDSCHHKTRQYPCRSQLCKVNEELSHGAYNTADHECFQYICYHSISPF